LAVVGGVFCCVVGVWTFEVDGVRLLEEDVEVGVAAEAVEVVEVDELGGVGLDDDDWTAGLDATAEGDGLEEGETKEDC